MKLSNNNNLKIYSTIALSALVAVSTNINNTSMEGGVFNVFNVSHANSNVRYVKLNSKTSTLNFRREPSTNTKTSTGLTNVICGLKHGQAVTINSQIKTRYANGVTWQSIRYNNTDGWVDSSKLSSTNPNQTTTTTSTTTVNSDLERGTLLKTETYRKVTTSGSNLNMRKTPTTSGTVVGYLKNGEVVEVLRETGQWYLVRKGNLLGWSSKTYLKSTTEKAKLESWYHKDAESEISINKIRKYGSDVYVANLKIQNPSQFKHVYSDTNYIPTNSSAVKNMKTVKEMTDSQKALFAINASRFSSKGEIFGTTGAEGKINKFVANQRIAAMDQNGKLHIMAPKTITELENIKPSWVATFGPALVFDYKNMHSAPGDTERHPRMAIGQKTNANEFIIIAVDGRSPISQGVNYYEMAELYRSYGAKLAYNLDGGGSATMVFKGTVINKPSDAQGPRKVADSLFIRNIK